MTLSSPVQDMHAVEEALHELLLAMEEHDEVRRQRSTDPASPEGTEIKVERLTSDNIERSAFNSFVRNPVRYALLEGIARAGRELNRLGGIEGMQKALERVAARRPDRESRRTSLVDYAWNGIGEGADRWWA